MLFKDDPKSPAAEAYRTLRTNLEFSNLDGEVKSIVVTSALPGEGKSTLTANLAFAQRNNDKKVLLVDCDFKKPRLHKVFEVNNGNGFTNFVKEGTGEIQNKIHEIYPAGPWLFTTGPLPPNSADFLASEKVKEFFQKKKEEYDMVIVDAPPLMIASDAAILASYLDGVILVLASGQVSKEEAKKAKDQLDKANARILGTILNKVTSKKSSYYYYYADE